MMSQPIDGPAPWTATSTRLELTATGPRCR